MRTTAWSTGGCRSWYKDSTGRNSTLWPGSTLRYRRESARFNPADWSHLGRGFMAEYEQAGLVFAKQADADLELLARDESTGGE